MSSGLWEKALKILKINSHIDDVIYDSVLSKMREVTYEDNILILSCNNSYTLDLAKSEPLSGYIHMAIKTVSDRPITVKFIEEGDENAARASIISEKKVQNKIDTDSSTDISEQFTFANFVVGDCNRFAQASAVSVANNPGLIQRNPLYFWGNSGLGKTHLMKAIGYQIKQNFPDKSVLYTTCEGFTNAYVASMQAKTYDEFRNKYRNIDVLLIDDIQFLIGKEGTQMEFFNTFETLINAGKQIVITSDKAPSNLTELDERLKSRFKNGILMDIQPPDFETRKAILMKKAEADHLNLSDDIINYVCENVTTNVRELNGAYNTISSYMTLSNGDMDLEMVQKLLVSIVSPSKKKYITPDMIINAVSKYYDVTSEKIMGTTRNKEIVNARGVAMFILREILEMGYKDIGSYFGNKTHSTVMHSIKNIEDNDELCKEAQDIIKRLTDF